ncbi:MAG: hypothetical protein K2V38_11865 [Gemmataceae bacterium]|nr:hypothetical protein [Gemmataceae bacterium]
MTLRPIALLALAFAVSPARAQEKAEPPKVSFDGQVKAILAKHCLRCHNAERPRGELDLSTFAGVTFGGASGKAVVAGKPENSPLYTMTAHIDEPKMPPNAPRIPQGDLDTIKNWIAGGLLEKAEKAGGTAATLTQAKNLDGLTAPAALARATPVTALAVSPAAPLVAVPGKKQVLLYELPSGKLTGALAFPEGEVHAIKFSPDGKLLLVAGGVGGQSGAVVGYEVGAWKRLFTLTDDNDAVLAADVSADKKLVVFGGPTKLVKVASVPDGKIVHTFRKPTDWALAVGFSPEGLLVAAGDRFGGLFVWETKSGKEFATLRGHTKAVTGVAWRADSDALATSSEDGTVRVWDMHTGAESARWDAHGEGVIGLAWHPSGVLATSGRDGRAKLWDAKGKLAAALSVSDDVLTRVALTADARGVVSADWLGVVTVTPVAGGAVTKLALPVESKPVAVALVPVPTPNLPVAATRPTPGTPTTSSGGLQADLARKRAALKAVEEAAEKLKEEAARNPKNPALAKAYLQLCEAALAMKAEVIEAEAAVAKAEGK